MDSFAGRNKSELLEIVQKVFDNRDSREDLLAKNLGQAIMAVLQAQVIFHPIHPLNKKSKHLKKNQFTYYK